MSGYRRGPKDFPEGAAFQLNPNDGSSPTKWERMGSEGFQAEEQSEQNPGGMTHLGPIEDKVDWKCGP